VTTLTAATPRRACSQPSLLPVSVTSEGFQSQDVQTSPVILSPEGLLHRWNRYAKGINGL